MASGFAESRYPSSSRQSESGYGGSSSGGYNNQQNMAAYRANKAALGGRQMTQANLDEAARVGALGRNSNGDIVRDSSAWDRAASAPTSPQSGSSMQDYIDMISNAAFGGGARPANPQVAPVPATMSPQLAASRLGAGAAPIPAVASDQLRLQQQLNNGVPLEALAAGVAGAGVGYLAKSLLDRVASAKGETITPGSGVYNGPNVDLGPGNSGQMIPVVKGSGSTRVPQGTQVFGDPMDWFFTNGVIDGEYEDITGKGNRGITDQSEPRLQTGDDGITRETTAPRYTGNDAIPGPDSRARRLGDMDSPNYRSQMGLDDTIDATLDPETAQRAEEVYNTMKSYGYYEPEAYGITPESNPSLYNRVMRLIRPQ